VVTSNFPRAVALALAAVLAAGAGVIVAPAAAASAAPDDEWGDLSSKLGGIYGEWTTEAYENAINSTMPNTAILGNGDVGVSSAGTQGVKTFIISKGDFWNGSGGVRSAGLGGVTIQPVDAGDQVVNLAVGKTATSSSNDGPFPASRAISGTWAAGYEGWVSGVGKPQWMRIDLGAPTEIGRVVIRHDAAARPAETQNTSEDFEIQVSDNGTDWTTIESFVDNTAATTDVTVDPVTTRYVRLYLTTPTQETTPDSTNNPRARIGAFELYAPIAVPNLALGSTATTSSAHPSFPGSRAISGTWAAGYEGWVSNVGKPQWLQLDLGADKTFDRWVVKHDAAARPAETANVSKAFELQVSSNGTNWTTVDSVTGNTLATTDRSFTATTARYVRLYLTTPTQESNSDSTNNPRARIGQFELYLGAGETAPPPVAPPFHEVQNILDPSIDTEMTLGEAEVSMHTWQGADENVVVTELTSQAEAAVELQLSTWAGAGNANGSYTNASGVSGSTLWATRQTSTSGTPLWVSRAALSTRLIGADLEAPTASGATAKGTFTLEPGATVYIVTGVGGGGQNPTTHLTTAQALAAAQDEETITALAAAKAAWWKDYWLASWVDLGDAQLEKYYYGAQYIIGSASKPGKLAPGLYGIWYTQDNPSFSGDMHLNYNFQAPWYGVYSSNRPELALPMYDLIEDYVPEAQRRASTYSELRKLKPDYVDSRPELSGGADGILFPVGIGPWGSTTDNQYWNQTSNGLFNAMMYIDYWEYTGDQEFLTEQAYPYLKEEIAFFEDWLDEDENGQLNLWAGAHEGEWGRNSSPDVPFLRNVLVTAIEASELLGEDVTERAVWQDMLDRLAPTPTITRNGQSVYALADQGVPGTTTSVFHPGDNTVNLEVVHPGDEVNLHSDPTDLLRAQNTITQMNSWGQDNAFPKVFTQAVRAGYNPQTIITQLKNQLTQKMRGNLRVYDPFHGIEKSGATEALNSMLMQSSAGVVDVFPVWPTTMDASFARLLAKGAFEVSATQTAGEVTDLSITSTIGGDLVVTNPWSSDAISVTDSEGDLVDYDVADGRISLDTVAGETYSFAVVGELLSTEAPEISGDAVVGETLTASEGTWNLGDLEFEYQWKRDGADIADAHDASYALVAADYDSIISVEVTATRDPLAPASAESAGTAAVGEVDAPSVEGSVVPAAATSGWHTTEPSLTVTATDALSGVDTIEYRIDGGSWLEYTAPVPVADGVELLEFRATDLAGNTSEPGSLDVLVDTVVPTVTPTLSSARVLTVAASDSGSGVARIEYSVDAAGWQTYASAVTFDEKPHAVLVRAVDVAGNTGAAQLVRVAGGSLSATTVEAGAQVTVHASGFEPGEDVAIEFQSTPVLLATVAADEDGDVTYIATVPADAASGVHHIVLTGSESDVVVSLALVVTPTAVELALTGGTIAGGAIVLSLLFLLAGWALMVIRRRQLT
jgi:hypothetical protein